MPKGPKTRIVAPREVSTMASALARAGGALLDAFDAGAAAAAKLQRPRITWEFGDQDDATPPVVVEVKKP